MMRNEHWDAADGPYARYAAANGLDTTGVNAIKSRADFWAGFHARDDAFNKLTDEREKHYVAFAAIQAIAENELH
jgi:hypothetical protein